MFIFLLALVLIGTIILVYHISIEMNGIEKKVSTLTASLENHYDKDIINEEEVTDD